MTWLQAGCKMPPWKYKWQTLGPLLTELKLAALACGENITPDNNIQWCPKNIIPYHKVWPLPGHKTLHIDIQNDCEMDSWFHLTVDSFIIRESVIENQTVSNVTRVTLLVSWVSGNRQSMIQVNFMNLYHSCVHCLLTLTWLQYFQTRKKQTIRYAFVFKLISSQQKGKVLTPLKATSNPIFSIVFAIWPMKFPLLNPAPISNWAKPGNIETWQPMWNLCALWWKPTTQIPYVIRELANLGSWPLIFCSCLYCTKYQNNYIIGKLESRSIEWEYLKNINCFKSTPWMNQSSYSGTIALWLCSHDAASTWPALHVQNYRSLTQFFAQSNSNRLKQLVAFHKNIFQLRLDQNFSVIMGHILDIKCCCWKVIMEIFCRNHYQL